MSNKNLDFLHILAHPVMYTYPSFQKPNYSNLQPFCDRCSHNLTVYFSSKATPQTDLCQTCFQALKDDDSSLLVVSGPSSVTHHSTSSPAQQGFEQSNVSPFSTMPSAGMRGNVDFPSSVAK